MNQLITPKGWKKEKLLDVIVDIANGTSEKQVKEKCGLPVTRIETISKEFIDLSKVRYIPEPSTKLISKYKLDQGDILFSHINSLTHLGKTAIFELNESVLHGTNLLRIIPNKSKINPRFLNYFLNFLRHTGYFLKISHKSVNQSSINQTKLKQIDVLTTNMKIQERIVKKLDYILGEFNRGKNEIYEVKKTNSKRLEQLFKFYKNELTSDLLQQKKSPDNWKKTVLEETFEEKKQKWQPDGNNELVNYIGLENIESNTGNLVKFTPTKMSEIKSSKTYFRKKDILYGRLRPYLNKVFVPSFDGICSTDILVLKPRENVITEFLLYFLRSQNVLEIVSKMMRGERPRIKISDLEEIKIVLPKVYEQKEIVKKLMDLEKNSTTFLQMLNSIIISSNSNVEKLEKLYKTIIYSAFLGKF